jgi:hypothetical protein
VEEKNMATKIGKIIGSLLTAAIILTFFPTTSQAKIAHCCPRPLSSELRSFTISDQNQMPKKDKLPDNIMLESPHIVVAGNVNESSTSDTENN